jgi:hypothetical protein
MLVLSISTMAIRWKVILSGTSLSLKFLVVGTYDGNKVLLIFSYLNPSRQIFEQICVKNRPEMVT